MIKINLSSKNKGQVLIVALVAMMVLFVLAIVVIESGNLIYEKVHMQNIADSGAMEGGLWYARSLNILSVTNKVLLCAGIIAGAITFIYPPAAADAEKIPEIMQKIQDIFAGTGDFEKWKIKPAPFMDMIMVLRNGYNNGVFSMPLFNVYNFGENGFNPSFNVERTYLSDVGNEKITYYIDSKCDGATYYFKGPASEVYPPNGGKTYQLIESDCYIACGKKRCGRLYVSKKVERKKKSEKLLPLTIEETGGHSVLVVSIKTDVKQLLNSGFLTQKSADGSNKNNPIQPSFLLSTAMTTIDGGSMTIWDLNGAGYTPKLRHVVLPKIQQTAILKDLKDYIKYVDMLSGQVSNNILLH